MFLYHATYKPYLQSIKKYGLSSKFNKSWEGSEDEVIYLATDPDVAYSYAEIADIVPEDFADKIVILKIDIKGIDDSLLELDSNNLSKDTLQYRGVISPEYIQIEY